MFRKRKNWAQAESIGLNLILNSLFFWRGGLNLWKETSTKIYNAFFVLPGALQFHLCKLSGLSGYTVQTYFYYSQNYLSFSHMLCTSFKFQFVFCFDLQLRLCFRVFSIVFIINIIFGCIHHYFYFLFCVCHNSYF